MLHCKVLAPKFGVTPKTVRDIWNGRTWFSATKPYWSKVERQRKAYFASDAYDDVAAADIAAPIIAEQLQPQSAPPQHQLPAAPGMQGMGGGHGGQKAVDMQMQGKNGGLNYPGMNIQSQQNAMIYKNNMDNMKTLQMAMGGQAPGLSVSDLHAFAGAGGGMVGMGAGGFGGMGLQGIAHNHQMMA